MCFETRERIIRRGRKHFESGSNREFKKLENGILDYSICRSIMNSRCLFCLNYDDFMDVCVQVYDPTVQETREIIIPLWQSFGQTEFLIIKVSGLDIHVANCFHKITRRCVEWVIFFRFISEKWSIVLLLSNQLFCLLRKSLSSMNWKWKSLFSFPFYIRFLFMFRRHESRKLGIYVLESG